MAIIQIILSLLVILVSFLVIAGVVGALAAIGDEEEGSDKEDAQE